MGKGSTPSIIMGSIAWAMASARTCLVEFLPKVTVSTYLSNS